MVFFNLDYGYVSVIFLLINILCYLTKSTPFKSRITFVLCTLMVWGVSAIFLDSDNPNVENIIPERSYCEIATFLFLTILYALLLLKDKKTVLFIITLLTIPLQFKQFLYLISYEFVGISSFVIVFLQRKENARLFFSIVYITVSIVVLLIIYNWSWENIIPDLRHNKVIHIKTEGTTYYYELRNVEDCEKKTKMIFNIIDFEKDGKYVFLEDKTAAYSFKRTSIRMPALFDNNKFSFDEKLITPFVIQISNGFIVNDFKYKSSGNIDLFEIVEQKADTIIINTKTDLTLKTISDLCAFIKKQNNNSFPQNYVLLDKNSNKMLLELIDDNKYIIKFM